MYLRLFSFQFCGFYSVLKVILSSYGKKINRIKVFCKWGRFILAFPMCGVLYLRFLFLLSVLPLLYLPVHADAGKSVPLSAIGADGCHIMSQTLSCVKWDAWRVWRHVLPPPAGQTSCQDFMLLINFSQTSLCSSSVWSVLIFWKQPPDLGKIALCILFARAHFCLFLFF